MGIAPSTASRIIQAHKNQPMTGEVLMCGRQSMFLTPAQAVELMRHHGVVPQISIDACELDHETRIGGEGQDKRSGDAISDHSFFKMLGVERFTVLDHSDYEGASLLVDLNIPVDPELESKFDFIIDGGTLDNVFNPAQALMNIARMLRPGGRLLTYNLYTNHFTPYTMLPHQWYLDYFAINNFVYGQVYFIINEFCGDKSCYQVNLKKRAATHEPIGNFPIVDPTSGIGTTVYAVKGAESTWQRQPSQEYYRSDEEWNEIAAVFSRFAAYDPGDPLVCSTSTLPIFLPGADDFEYIAVGGVLVTQSNREHHDRLLCARILAMLRQMDQINPSNQWGIFELEAPFYHLIGESGEAREIVAKENVILFDARMLKQNMLIDNVRKEVYPAATALLLDIPILILSTTPQLDALWKRVVRYFRHSRLHSAFHGNLAQYIEADASRAGISLSVSLEHGEYKGLPSTSMRRIHEMLGKPMRDHDSNV